MSTCASRPIESFSRTDLSKTRNAAPYLVRHDLSAKPLRQMRDQTARMFSRQYATLAPGTVATTGEQTYVI